MGTHLSIDETSLSQGELNTIVINKAAKGKKGSLVVIQQIEDQSTSYANEQRSYKCLFIYLQSSLKGRFYYCCFKARASFWLRCLPRHKWWFLYRKPRSEYSYKSSLYTLNSLKSFGPCPTATQCERLPMSTPAARGLTIFIEISSFSVIIVDFKNSLEMCLVHIQHCTVAQRK